MNDSFELYVNLSSTTILGIYCTAVAFLGWWLYISTTETRKFYGVNSFSYKTNSEPWRNILAKEKSDNEGNERASTTYKVEIEMGEEDSEAEESPDISPDEDVVSSQEDEESQECEGNKVSEEPETDC